MSKLIAFFTGGWGPIVGVVALLGSLWAGYAYVVHSARSEGRAEIQAMWDADKQAQALLAAVAAEQKRLKERQHEIAIKNERRAREADVLAVGRVLADTRASLNRLRDTTATVAGEAASDPATGFGVETAAARVGLVFNECAGSLVEMAEQTEQLGVRLRGLQAWADSAVGVCGSE